MGFGARRSASTPGESRGALRLVHLNEDGARGEISSVPRVAAASRSRRASRRLGFHDFRGGQGGRVRRVLSSCAVSSRTVAWRRRRVRDGWVRVGRDDGERFALVRAVGLVRRRSWCARVVQWRPRGELTQHTPEFSRENPPRTEDFWDSPAAHSLFSPRARWIIPSSTRPRSSYPRALAGVASCRGDARLTSR